MPRIDIRDTDRNWLNWGELVLAWISKQQPRPTTVAALRAQLRAHKVRAKVAGRPTRPVRIRDYSDSLTSTLYIYIPSKKMLADKFKYVKAGRYSHKLMPRFYDDEAYRGAQRARMTKREADSFAIRRVGEYTVNECC
jgi:hypothetical protein